MATMGMAWLATRYGDSRRSSRRDFAEQVSDQSGQEHARQQAGQHFEQRGGGVALQAAI